MDIEKAYLSNDKDMIKFQYGNKIIRFRGWQNISITKGWRRNTLI